MSLTAIVRDTSKRIHDGRTVLDAAKHMGLEVKELRQEIVLSMRGEPPGPDGVIGEAIDAIQCGLDVIFLHRPDITDAELDAIMVNKCIKWLDVYGHRNL